MKTKIFSSLAVLPFLIGCLMVNSPPPPPHSDLLQQANQLKKDQLFSSALESYRQAKLQSDSLGQEELSLQCTAGMAHCWWALHRSDSAIALCRQAVDSFGEAFGKKPLALAEIYTILGNVHADKRTADDFRRAMSYYEKALEVLKYNNANTTDVVMARERFGIANWLIGNYEEARHWYSHCLQEMPPIDSSNAAIYATLHSRMGSVLEDMGKVRAAAESVQKAYDISTKYKLAKGVAEAEFLNKLGRMQLKSGDPGQALVSYEAALYLQNNFGEKQNKLTALILGGLADCQCRLGEDARALANYQRAKNYWREGERDLVNGLQTLLRQMAGCHLRHNRPATAARLQQEALSIVLKTYGTQSIAYLNIQKELGESKQQSGEYQAAFIHLNNALNTAAQLLGRNHPEILEIQLRLAETKMLSGEPDGCKAILNSIAEEQELTPVLKNSILPGLQYERLSADLNMAEYEVEKDVKVLRQALRHYSKGIALAQNTQRQFLNEESELHLQKTVKALCEKGLECCIALQETAPAEVSPEVVLTFIEASSNVLLTGAHNTRLALAESTIPVEKAKQLADLQQQCKYYYYRMNAPPDENRIAATSGGEEKEWQLSYFEALRQLENLHEELANAYPEYRKRAFSQTTPSAAAIKTALGKEDAFYAFYEGKEHLYRFRCQGSSCSFEQLAPVKAYSPLLDSLLSMLYAEPRRWQSDRESNEQFRQFCRQSHRMYRLLIGEPLDRTGKVVYTASGRLNYLPLDILLEQLPEASTKLDWRSLPYLFKTHPVQVVETPGLWLSPVAGAQPSRAYAGFAPDFTEGNAKSTQLPALSNNTKEVKQAAALWAGSAFTEGEATVENFWRNADHSAILHLATHARINNNFPDNSRLYFSARSRRQNYLSAWEIASHQIPASLVILSACNTGYGKLVSGDGVHSLSRAFRLAGAGATLMSLWPESDHSVSDLILPFMKNLKMGMPKSRALQMAKTGFLQNTRNDRMTHPYYWANLVLTGNDEPLLVEAEEQSKAGGASVWLLVLFAGLAAYGIWNRAERSR